MTLNTMFLLLDEHPQKLMFICPCCDHQNFIEATIEIGSLYCAGCGILVSGSDATLEVLTSNPVLTGPPRSTGRPGVPTILQ